MTGTLKNKENGFSALEAILILVIVGLLGFTCWFVWHAKQTTDKNLTADNSTVPSFKNNASASGVLTITRNNPAHHPDAQDLKMHITNQATIKKLYQDIQKLPTDKSVYSGEVNCPADYGLSYELQFTNPKLTATYGASGCQIVKLSTTKTVYAVFGTGPSSTFQTDFSNAIMQPIDPLQRQ